MNNNDMVQIPTSMLAVLLEHLGGDVWVTAKQQANSHVSSITVYNDALKYATRLTNVYKPSMVETFHNAAENHGVETELRRGMVIDAQEEPSDGTVPGMDDGERKAIRGR
jgi:hypothetical protein